MDVFRPRWREWGCGGGGEEVGGACEHLYTRCLRGCHTTRLWGSNEWKKTANGNDFSHTHAFKDCILFISRSLSLSIHRRSCAHGASSRADTAISDKTQSSKSSSTFSRVPDDGCPTLRASAHSAFKGESTASHCQLPGFNVQSARRARTNKVDNWVKKM